jgi:predicted HTH domain antitoxin
METTAIPKRIRQKFVDEILDMYASEEISAGKASEMLGIPRAAFYQVLAEKRTPLPKKLEESIKQELENLA